MNASVDKRDRDENTENLSDSILLPKQPLYVFNKDDLKNGQFRWVIPAK